MKKIIVMLILVIGILLPTKVNALTDSFYVGEYLNGEYMVKAKNGTGRYQQLHAFRRTRDNRLAYCIELWEGLNENKNLSGYNSNQSSYAKLTNDTWNRVMLLAYYGYGYKNHNDMKWYALTQIMIWETIATDSEVYFTDTLNGNKIDKYRNERNELEDLISKHYILPSFANQRFYIDDGEQLTLTDTNGVLSSFNNVDNYGLSVYRSGNNLTLKSKITTGKSIRIIKNDITYSDKTTVYIDNNGQDVLVPGKFDLVSFSVFFCPQKYDVIINKLDKDTNMFDNSLIGTKIAIIDSNGNRYQTKEIDETGKLIFNDVVTGNYYLKEESTSPNYKLNTTLIPITVNKNSKEFTIYNEKIKNRIIINKYLKNTLTNEIKKEEDATFRLYDNENNLIKEFNTSNDGKYEFDLDYGKYTLKQITGKRNYKLIDDLELEVVEDEKTQEFNLYNEELIVNLKLINTDSDSKLPILESEATFMIIDKDNNIIRLNTNNVGETIEIPLSSGKYTIKQEKAVDGYIINKDEIELNIDEDNYEYDSDITLEIPNEKEKSKVSFNKKIEYYFDDKLVDSEIDNSITVPIYAKDDIYTKDGLKVYDKNSEVDNVSIDNDLISKELLYGNYYIKDVVSDKEIDFTLNDNSIKKISFLEKKYDYSKPIEIAYDDKDEIEVPNTYSKEKVDYYILFTALGIVLIKRKKYEKNN